MNQPKVWYKKSLNFETVRKDDDMGDLISKSALIKNIREISTSLLNEWDTAGVMTMVYKQPSVDAVPVVHG